MWTMLEDQTEQNGAISDINIIMIQVKHLKLQFNGVLPQVEIKYKNERYIIKNETCPSALISFIQLGQKDQGPGGKG